MLQSMHSTVDVFLLSFCSWCTELCVFVYQIHHISTMFEAALTEAKLLKSIIEAIKDIITDANFEISNAGIELQAMDNAHVALVALRLDAEGFEHFRCDRTFSLGTPVVGAW